MGDFPTLLMISMPLQCFLLMFLLETVEPLAGTSSMAACLNPCAPFTQGLLHLRLLLPRYSVHSTVHSKHAICGYQHLFLLFKPACSLYSSLRTFFPLDNGLPLPSCPFADKWPQSCPSIRQSPLQGLTRTGLPQTSLLSSHFREHTHTLPHEFSLLPSPSGASDDAAAHEHPLPCSSGTVQSCFFLWHLILEVYDNSGIPFFPSKLNTSFFLEDFVFDLATQSNEFTKSFHLS